MRNECEWMKYLSWILPNERTRHVVVAAVIAFAIGISTLFYPVDRLVWLMESRLNPQPVSGEIVFLSSDTDLTDPEAPQRREDLARVLRDLDRAGAKHVYLDMIFARPSSQVADAKLAEAISSLGNRVSLVRRNITSTAGVEEISRSIPRIVGTAEETVVRQYFDFLGYAWEMDTSIETPDGKFESLSAALSDVDPQINTFQIDYNYSLASIPQVDFARFADAKVDPGLREDVGKQLFGKSVVVGLNPQAGTSEVSIPGHTGLPGTIVSIYAAETLKSGIAPKVGGLETLAAFMTCLLIICRFLTTAIVRRGAIAALLVAPLGLVVLFSNLAITPQLSPTLAFLGIFVLLRNWSHRKSRREMHDDVIDLPTFRAMERDLALTGQVDRTTVVVAKVHRFDEVTSTLDEASVAEYVRQIANRFCIADEDLQIYTKGGRYLGWLVEDANPEMLESHMRGLRAIFAHPLMVNGTAVDVGITFAADSTQEDSAARKIASASSTVEKTTEAHEPVLFAELASEGERWWSISLQAKIDEALAEGHIYPVFQPQIDLRTGAVVGAEALVRWNDPERGSISPSYFIEQCENAGRMDHLTRHVLEQSISAAQEFSQHGDRFNVSVNISATLLRDFRVAEMVEEILARTGFKPENLVLEVTETSRIADYDVAQTVMERLRMIGIKLSIDDFGVGAASFETLLRLPFDELKIDRAFISRMNTDQKARSIAQLLIAFGKQSRITVVAEGVEDERSLAVLRSAGCEFVQGFHISKPLRRSDFIKFQPVRRENVSRASQNG